MLTKQMVCRSSLSASFAAKRVRNEDAGSGLKRMRFGEEGPVLWYFKPCSITGEVEPWVVDGRAFCTTLTASSNILSAMAGRLFRFVGQDDWRLGAGHQRHLLIDVAVIPGFAFQVHAACTQAERIRHVIACVNIEFDQVQAEKHAKELRGNMQVKQSNELLED